MRNKILELVRSIAPFDDLEKSHVEDAARWIESGAEIFRIKKPDISPKHLVSCFVPVDAEKKKFLLVDHKKAQLWFPPGGHIEVNEDPKVTVEREIREELGIRANFLFENPFFITQAITVGLTAGHTDVCFWYLVRGDSEAHLNYDTEEFNGYKWFDYGEMLSIPIEKLDPNFHRFLSKFCRICRK